MDSGKEEEGGKVEEQLLVGAGARAARGLHPRVAGATAMDTLLHMSSEALTIAVVGPSATAGDASQVGELRDSLGSEHAGNVPTQLEQEHTLAVTPPSEGVPAVAQLGERSPAHSGAPSVGEPQGLPQGGAATPLRGGGGGAAQEAERPSPMSLEETFVTASDSSQWTQDEGFLGGLVGAVQEALGGGVQQAVEWVQRAVGLATSTVDTLSSTHTRVVRKVEGLWTVDGEALLELMEDAHIGVLESAALAEGVQHQPVRDLLARYVEDSVQARTQKLLQSRQSLRASFSSTVAAFVRTASASPGGGSVAAASPRTPSGAMLGGGGATPAPPMSGGGAGSPEQMVEVLARAASRPAAMETCVMQLTEPGMGGVFVEDTQDAEGTSRTQGLQSLKETYPLWVGAREVLAGLGVTVEAVLAATTGAQREATRIRATETGLERWYVVSGEGKDPRVRDIQRDAAGMRAKAEAQALYRKEVEAAMPRGWALAALDGVDSPTETVERLVRELARHWLSYGDSTLAGGFLVDILRHVKEAAPNPTRDIEGWDTLVAWETTLRSKGVLPESVPFLFCAVRDVNVDWSATHILNRSRTGQLALVLEGTGFGQQALHVRVMLDVLVAQMLVTGAMHWVQAHEGHATALAQGVRKVTLPEGKQAVRWPFGQDQATRESLGRMRQQLLLFRRAQVLWGGGSWSAQKDLELVAQLLFPVRVPVEVEGGQLVLREHVAAAHIKEQGLLDLAWLRNVVKYATAFGEGNGLKGAATVLDVAAFLEKAHQAGAAQVEEWSKCFLLKAAPALRCELCSKVGHTAKDCYSVVVCKACGKLGHMAKDCKAAATCGTCGKLGHTAGTCKSPKGAGDITALLAQAQARQLAQQEAAAHQALAAQPKGGLGQGTGQGAASAGGGAQGGQGAGKGPQGGVGAQPGGAGNAPGTGPAGQAQGGAQGGQGKPAWRGGGQGSHKKP